MDTDDAGKPTLADSDQAGHEATESIPIGFSTYADEGNDAANSGNRNILTGKLKAYQNKLLNISRNNRCVCLKKIYRKHNFDLAKLDTMHEGTSDRVVKSILGRKSPICILRDSDAADGTDQIRTHLKNMHRSIRSAEDETGAQYCYVGFPFLEGRMSRDYYARAPLVLFPVSVCRDTGRKPNGWYVKPHDGEPILNRTLFAAMKKIGGFQTPKDFEMDFDDLMSSSRDKDFDLAARLAELLSKNDIPVELSKRTFPDAGHDPAEISPWRFPDKTRDELDQIEGRTFKITNYRIVGSFPQGEGAIYKDYEDMIDSGRADGFIASILDAGSGDPAQDADDCGEVQDEPEIDKVADRHLNMVLPSDSSQDIVVLKSQSERVTLVRGPPGTGKSQVIVNIIANALSKKQTILVVCQKRAALEVVQQRLAEKDLDKRAVLLSREKEDRAKMYAQIREMLRRTGKYAKQVDTELRHTSDQIDRLISSRAEITAALYDESFGINAQRLYSVSERSGSRSRLKLDAVIDDLTFSDLNRALKSMSGMEQNYKRFETASYPWFARVDFSSLAGTAKNDIEELLSAIKSSSKDYIAARDLDAQEQLTKLTASHALLAKRRINLQSSSDSFRDSISALLKKADKGDLSTHKDLDQIKFNARAGASLWAKFDTVQNISRALDRAIIEESLQGQQTAIRALSEASPSFLEKIFNSEKRKNAAVRKEFLARPENAGLGPADMASRLDDGLQLWLIAKDLHCSPAEIEDPIVLSDRNAQDRLLEHIADFRSCGEDLADCEEKLAASSGLLRALLKENGIDADVVSDPDHLKQKATNGRHIHESILQLSQFFQPESNPLRTVASDQKMLQESADKLFEKLSDFEDLRQHDSRKQELDKFTRDLLERCSLYLEAGDDWRHAVRQEAYNAWIEALEAKHPILRRGFDDYSAYAEELKALVSEKSRLIARQIVDSAKAPLTRRRVDLDYELGKKRRIKPVRQLIEEFRHAIFYLVPCWLASPETVSNIFPLEKGMFDMIIVDEASQLAAERTMPFLYRGKRKVIAGDENQLKPHDLFQMQDDEDEDDEVSTIESLLDLVRRRHPTHMLQWHYRSESQELIDFSNHAFYNGRLHVAPNVQKKPPKPSITWIDCKGVWENQANQAEATRVVEEIYRILQDAERGRSKVPTLGIITFNVKQRDAVLDQIDIKPQDPEFARLYSLAEHPESGKKDDEIFIRNIENVQGDEREIIIFSVGYAKDPEGRIRMQFGSLNKEGGENRLNVAATRASRQIIVACSFDPHDMNTDSLTHKGPGFLKSFLLYARAVSKRDDERVEQILSQLKPAMARRDAGSSEPGSSLAFESPFEEMVHDRLLEHGYKVAMQVGQSGYRIDLAIVDPRNPARYILGIECDGAQYHSAKSTRERDVYRQRFLESKGWAIARIWSRDWWRDPEAEIEKIRRRVEDLAVSP